ncbi:MAG: hypothetical protein KGL74_03340 [Elusimicrobia bacterium]|nr:hypothetical protein [Elusimicrobiota bacterium]
MRLALLAVLLAASPAGALVQNVGTSSAEFLRLGAGARSLGMGEASTAVSEGPDAVYWNPAGLGQMTRPEVLYARTELPAGVHHDYLAYAAPSTLFHGTVAFALTRLSQDKLALVDASNQTVGSFSPHSEVYSFAYGHQFSDNDPAIASRDYFRDNWNLPRADRPYEDEMEPWTGEISAGGAVKVISEDLGTRRATAFAVDGGMLFRPSALHELILAGAIRHLGQKIRFITANETLPTEAAVSAAYDARLQDWRLLPALEVDAPYAGNFFGKAGFEATHDVGSRLSAAGRIGYSSRTAPDLGALSGLSFGVGLKAGGFRFDAAFQPMSLLGSSLRVGAGWKF